MGNRPFVFRSLVAVAVLAGFLPMDAPLPATQDKPQEQAIEIAAVDLRRAVDFNIDILPILRKNCVACHHGPDAEAKLVLESPASILKGSESGPVVVPGKSGESLLLMAASLRKKPSMPPKKNKVGAERLTPKDLGLIKLWIDQGAKGSTSPQVDAPLLKAAPSAWHPIYDLAVDAAGQNVVCGRAGRLYIYNVPTRRLIDQPSDPKLAALAHQDAVQAMSFSPDGSLLATGGYREIKLWRKQQPENQAHLDLEGEVKAATVSRDGARIAVAGADPTIKVFALASGKLVAQIKGHAEAVQALRFSADGAALLSGSADKTVRIWKVADGSAIGQIGTPAPVTAVEWLAEDKQIATGGADNMIRLWAAPEAQPPAEAPAPAPLKEFKGHTGPITDLRLAPGKSGGLLSASQDMRVRLWNLENGQVVRDLNAGAPVAALAVSPDGKRVAAVAANNTGKLWNAETGQAVGDLRTDGPSRRRDLLAAAALNFANNEVQFRTQAVKNGEDAKKKEEEELKKVADAIAALEKDAKDKQDALAKAAQDREAFEATIADFGKSAEAAKVRAEAAATALSRTDSEESLKLAEADHAAADKEFAAATQAAEGAKKKAEAAAQAMGAAAQAVEDAKKKGEAAAKALVDAAQGVDDAKKKAEIAAKAIAEAAQGLDAVKKKSEADKQAADKALVDANKAVEIAKSKGDQAGKTLQRVKSGLAVKKAETDKAAADKVLADLTQAAAPVKTAADAAAKAAADAKASFDAVAKAAPDAKAKLEAAAKAVGEAKARVDAGAKALGEAGDDAAKKEQAEKDKKAAEEALKKADGEKAAADQAAQKAAADRAVAEGASKKTESEKQAAEKALADATRKRDEAKVQSAAAATALQQAKAAHDQARKSLEADKAAAEQAVKAIETQRKDAEAKQQNAKKAEEAAAAALDVSKRNLESGNRRVEKAKDAVAKAGQSVQDTAAKLQKQKEEQQKVEADRKAAAEALAKAQLPLRGVAISLDGARVALGAEDGRVYLFGAETGEEAGVLRSHSKPVFAVGFGGGGALVSGAVDGSVRLGPAAPSWTLERTLAPSEPAQPPLDRVLALTFSPDGKALVSGGGIPSREGELLLWNVADGQLVRRFADAHSDTVYDVSFSADGTLLASAAADKFAKVFEASTGKLVRSFEGHTHHVLGVGWNRTARTLATAGADNVIKVWSLETGQQVRTIPGFDKQVTAIRYLGFDSAFAITSGGNAPVRVVNENGQGTRNIEPGPAYMYAISTSADGRLIAAGGLDGVLRLWRADNGQSIATFPPPTPEKP